MAEGTEVTAVTANCHPFYMSSSVLRDDNVSGISHETGCLAASSTFGLGGL